MPSKKPSMEEILLNNSVERVINLTMDILLKSKHPEADLNLDDWHDLKETVVYLWNDARNEAFKKGELRLR